MLWTAADASPAPTAPSASNRRSMSVIVVVVVDFDNYLERRERKKHEGMVVCFNVGHNGAGAGAEILFYYLCAGSRIHSCVRTGG